MMNLRFTPGDRSPVPIVAFAHGARLHLYRETGKWGERLPSQNPSLLPFPLPIPPSWATHGSGFQVKVRYRPAAFGPLIAVIHAIARLASGLIGVASNRSPIVSDQSAVPAANACWQCSWTQRPGNNSSLEERR